MADTVIADKGHVVQIADTGYAGAAGEGFTVRTKRAGERQPDPEESSSVDRKSVV